MAICKTSRRRLSPASCLRCSLSFFTVTTGEGCAFHEEVVSPDRYADLVSTQTRTGGASRGFAAIHCQ